MCVGGGGRWGYDEGITQPCTYTRITVYLFCNRHEFLLLHVQGNVSEMIEAVKAAFVERLETINTWLDEETKAASKEKVDAITKMVAFPDQLFNDSYLDGLYADVS